MKDKISTQHLERAAYVYVRQSTLHQVRHNVESHRRQYALRARAHELGFKNVRTIDDDLGVSGTGSRERPGFAKLLAAVCNGEAGAVFALEASRLARNNRDWHHLIDLCVLTETLVVDAEGIYDPRLLNDRMLLGLKGTMSEFELGILRQRAHEAYRQKVLRGEVLTRVPIGYVRSGITGIEMTPDRQVQEAIRGLFGLFGRLGTLRQALLWYHDEKVFFPRARVRDGASAILWDLPDYQQLLRILKSPVYAGAFAHGRTRCRSRVVEGRSRKSGGHRVPLEQWEILIKEHHMGYISWEQYLENLRVLASNRTKSHAVTCGAAREGSALLSGLLRCARCGHKLQVAYRGGLGNGARYCCLTGSRKDGKSLCQTFAAVKVDRAVADDVLEACQPLAVEASLQVLNATCAQQGEKRRMLELALERARYEVDRTRRQYDAVDPVNRLVAAELEARWNASLMEAQEAEARLSAASHAQPPITETQRARLLTLGGNLQELWNDPAAPVELRKRILRTVIQEIVVDLNHQSGHVELRIHWVGGIHTMLQVRKNQPGRNSKATNPDVVELVRELALAWSDGYIAAMLNRLGFETGPGNSWNETRVKNLRLYNKIPVYVEGTARSWRTMSEAAAELGVGVAVVRTMIARCLLPARQIAKGAPWMIEHADLKRPDVENQVRNARAGKYGPCRDDAQMLMPSL
jgi:DNA invertase Pin-like site-specific DNA recombinase